MKESRRNFLAEAAALGAACACGSIRCSSVGDTAELAEGAYRLSGDEIIIDLAKAPELAKVGGSAKITSIPDPIVVARIEDEKFIAASIACTHHKKEVEYKHDKKNLRCHRCDNSEFGLDGQVLSGPADKPLRVYPARLDDAGGRLVIQTSLS